ncbi:hypothetical protein J6590_093918 [Homalodisca vitripennis]|nr:hypothetical protein J6590_093918 [Homalodisca vitripennis]
MLACHKCSVFRWGGTEAGMILRDVCVSFAALLPCSEHHCSAYVLVLHEPQRVCTAPHRARLLADKAPGTSAPLMRKLFISGVVAYVPTGERPHLSPDCEDVLTSAALGSATNPHHLLPFSAHHDPRELSSPRPSTGRTQSAECLGARHDHRKAITVLRVSGEESDGLGNNLEPECGDDPDRTPLADKFYKRITETVKLLEERVRISVRYVSNKGTFTAVTCQYCLTDRQKRNEVLDRYHRRHYTGVETK